MVFCLALQSRFAAGLFFDRVDCLRDDFPCLAMACYSVSRRDVNEKGDSESDGIYDGESRCTYQGRIDERTPDLVRRVHTWSLSHHTNHLNPIAKSHKQTFIIKRLQRRCNRYKEGGEYEEDNLRVKPQ